MLYLFVEMARTSLWKDLPPFDFTDPRSLIVASSAGGKGIQIAATTSCAHRVRVDERSLKSVWDKDGLGRGVSSTLVRLRHDKSGNFKIVPVWS